MNKHWVVKKHFEFDNNVTPHINWSSFMEYVNIWGRVTITKDLATGKIVVEALAEE